MITSVHESFGLVRRFNIQQCQYARQRVARRHAPLDTTPSRKNPPIAQPPHHRTKYFHIRNGRLSSEARNGALTCYMRRVYVCTGRCAWCGVAYCSTYHFSVARSRLLLNRSLRATARGIYTFRTITVTTKHAGEHYVVIGDRFFLLPRTVADTRNLGSERFYALCNIGKLVCLTVKTYARFVLNCNVAGIICPTVSTRRCYWISFTLHCRHHQLAWCPPPACGSPIPLR